MNTLLAPSENPHIRQIVNAKTKEKLFTTTNMIVIVIANDERAKHTKLVTRFEKLSYMYPNKNAPTI